MKVLVTGATGFIGRRVAAKLAGLGARVVCTARRAAEEPSGVEWCEADLLAAGAAEALVRAVRPTHLAHFAWNAAPGRFWRAADNLDWAAATLTLTRAFIEAGGEAAVFAGTCAEYGWDRPRLAESDTPAPATLYGRVKNATREAVLAAGSEFDRAFAWGRVFWLYGPGEQRGRLVADVAAALARGEAVDCSEGLQARDFLHVDDVAGAFVAALSGRHRGVFNIASGQAVPVRQVVTRLGEALGRPDLVRVGARPSPKGEPPVIAGDSHVLNEVIGFAPRIPLDEGLRETALWWRGRAAS